MKSNLPDTEVIEVVMRRKMMLKDYYALQAKSKKTGWDCQAYEVGYYSGYKLKIEITF